MGDFQNVVQVDPLPQLKNLTVGATVGEGTFAIVKVGQLKKDPKRIVAVKYIHRATSHSKGVNDEKIGIEVRIHKECSGHPNIINLHMFGTDNIWVYLVMELAESGDLFDKIEPNVGVDEEIANFYFRQLINAVDYIHQKGVAHRDIKPENILLDKEGNLKLGDFGLATVYQRRKSKRLSHEQCGSPPYMAPEILSSDGYDPVRSDIWACGMVLFVLLTGQIAWQEPKYGIDEDFTKYVDYDGKLLEAPWNYFSASVRPLLQSILKSTPSKRFTMLQIRLHPWVNQSNTFMNINNQCKDSGVLAERLISSLHVGLYDDYLQELSRTNISSNDVKYVSLSQPTTANAFMTNSFDEFVPATQDPSTFFQRTALPDHSEDAYERILKIVSKDPSILQFTLPQHKMSQMTKSQNHVIQFNKLQLNATQNLTRFFSVLPIESLTSIIKDSLNRIGIRTLISDNHEIQQELALKAIYININALADRSKLPLKGVIKIMQCDPLLSLWKIDFIKTKGDPLEWRLFFKKVTLLSRDAVFIE
ncbi:uncharacterized protein PRCAT00004400001 [Priceomyces carsonii]|uniref:uncharacterized protein n=1 Tax=Priceomyces carsonii TaxID=28549 RepID=UPI002ED8BAC8|nr:unnamed protein product [Priceomyces carsonii]